MMMWRAVAVEVLLLMGIWQVSSTGSRLQPKQIAIVGGGVGGAAASHFLRREMGPDVKIDVFEAAAVGGRVATQDVGGDGFEMGACIIHPLNLRMKQLVDDIGLKARAATPSKMAVFDGKGLSFEESDWLVVNFLRVLWRYGLSYFRMNTWMDGVMGKFMRIYQYQQDGYSFSSVDSLLHAMGGDSFLALANQTLGEAMLAEGISQSFLDDLVVPVTRVNYGQCARIPGIVGAVAVAWASSGLWAVEGGNKRVCSGLLYHSKAQLIPARATAITLKRRPSKNGPTSDQYEVKYIDQSGPAQSLYDIVIVATPLHQGMSDIAFIDFSPPIPAHFHGSFHRTVSTLVHGRLNVSYLGSSENPADFRFSDVLTTDRKDLSFYSLHSLDPVSIPRGYRRPPASEKKVWKLFSPDSLTEDQLKEIFISWDDVAENRWLAYPSYVTPHYKSPSFVLHDHLYYLNAIEWSASAMEMSAISAKNLALLAHNRWHGQEAKIDQEDLHTRLRGEL
ncbi:prenylcysteine oxidase 1-like [Denticeps clupeoides]|uniref:Prenylcysteine oxidase 1 n=1 Tax=Denticeps clupeoides TaxID=299321 RepID=A0AAY4A3W9_9TELE|nr:prenylcysteine oxidase 1-like [Denticeps clupeoides]XP_028830592.1 prenylcysteine oxidase 1-like [Denticeps clupeoides]XP_028830593.1 prenylcysteine oxidase 1-like [Denticeps clupeoides]XP_028830594.1 prenylcysteine oxidase 1-like [Denticeps clupeoides]